MQLAKAFAVLQQALADGDELIDELVVTFLGRTQLVGELAALHEHGEDASLLLVLHQNLQEEEATDQKLTALAKSRVNQRAA